VDHIYNFAQKYGWETIAEIGIGAIFIGVESKFAGEHGYTKRKEVDARMVFDKLHSMGIRTLGAWVCGWDFHNHSNIYEDLNYFVACYPTYQQLTRLSPFPGTVLYEKLMEQNRVRDVPWEDVHFWSGSQENLNLETHETLNLTEYGYDLLYKTWGPSILRKLDVTLNGYEFCLSSDNPIMRDHKSLFFKQHAALLWTSIETMDRFAPNGVVRRRVRKTDEKYRRLIGEPTPVMEYLSKITEKRAKKFKIKNLMDPFNRYPKEEPFKKYLYDKDESTKDKRIPYKTIEPTKKPFAMKWSKFEFQAFAQILKMTRTFNRKKSDLKVDDFIIETIKRRNFIAF